MGPPVFMYCLNKVWPVQLLDWVFPCELVQFFLLYKLQYNNECKYILCTQETSVLAPCLSWIGIVLMWFWSLYFPLFCIVNIMVFLCSFLQWYGRQKCKFWSFAWWLASSTQETESHLKHMSQLKPFIIIFKPHMYRANLLLLGKL